MSKNKVESITLRPSECAKSIRAMIETSRAQFLWGPPGISKSQTAAQVATEEGIAFIDLRLSQMDPTDLRGIPYPTVVGGVTGVRWSTPYVMPRNLDVSFVVEALAEETIVHIGNPKGSNGIHYIRQPIYSVKAIGKGLTAKILSETKDSATVGLYDANGDLAEGKFRINATGDCAAILGLEEFNSAPPSVQAAAYQLVLDRRLGEYEVPDGVFIMGMGNRDTDKGVTFRMPTPIMNRFVHIEMRHDFDDWLKWALTKFVHPEVVGYLSAFKEDLFRFEPGTAARGFPTPRSWEFVSDILKKNDDLDGMVLIGLVAGCIGDGVGVKFVDFRKIAKDLPRADEILSGRLKKMPEGKRTEVSLSYALTTTLCYELKERSERIKREQGANWRASSDFKKWLEEADHFLKFIMENFQHEICVMGAKGAIAVHKLPFDTQKMKMFDEFATRFRGLIMGN